VAGSKPLVAVTKIVSGERGQDCNSVTTALTPLIETADSTISAPLAPPQIRDTDATRAHYDHIPDARDANVEPQAPAPRIAIDFDFVVRIASPQEKRLRLTSDLDFIYHKI